MPSDPTIKFGHVVFIGRPNTGKSTLLNTIMQQKVAITSPKPQTTRRNFQTLYQSDQGKIIFSDTPGVIDKVEDIVGKTVNKQTPEELKGADVVVYLVDISRPKGEEENKAIGLVRRSSAKKILVYNKIDKTPHEGHDHLAEYNFLEEEFDEVVSISALSGKNVKDLLNRIFKLLPEKPVSQVNQIIQPLLDAATPVGGLSSPEFISELIREKAYLFLRKEVPYSINVEVNDIQEKPDIIVVRATIYTTADRYRPMIIGKNGQKIKEIGFNARKELELISQKKVFLDLTVATDPHWPERLL